MKFELALLAIVASVNASRYGRRIERKFLNHEAKWGRKIHNMREYEKKLGNYLSNDAYIEENNKKAMESGDPDAVILGHNLMSDMDVEEMSGYFWDTIVPTNMDKGKVITSEDSSDDSSDESSDEEDEDSRGRRLATPNQFDHVAAGNMGPVKF